MQYLRGRIDEEKEDVKAEVRRGNIVTMIEDALDY
jgi:hypothetical protein